MKQIEQFVAIPRYSRAETIQYFMKSQEDDELLTKNLTAIDGSKVEIMYSERDHRTVAYILDIKGDRQEVKRVDMPLEIRSISDPKTFSRFLRDVYAKTSVLNNGDIRLDIFPRLRGGMVDNVSGIDASDATKELLQLITNLRELNSEKHEFLELINKLEQQTLEVNRAYLQPSQLVLQYSQETVGLSTKAIKDWGEVDIKTWSVEISKHTIQECAMPEVLAVVKQAVRCSEGYLPKDAQVLSVLYLLCNDDLQNSLAQIHAVEDKHTIVSMVAIVNILQKKRVNAAIKLEDLTQIDIEKKSRFYSLFGLTPAELSKYLGIHFQPATLECTLRTGLDLKSLCLGKYADVQRFESITNVSYDKSIERNLTLQKQNVIHLGRSSPVISISVGMIAGGLEAFLTHPLVTLKALSQNNTPFNVNGCCDIKNGLGGYFSYIKNSVPILYRGVYANVIGMSLIIATRILVRDSIIKYCFNTQEPSIFQQMVGAGGAGFVSAAITTPMELGMTLQQTGEIKKKAATLIDTYKNVVYRFGVRQGFTGLTCVGLRDTLVTASFLTFSNKLKETLRNNLDRNGININDRFLHLFSGVVAGTTCSVLTHPLDTIKTVQQAKLRSATKREEYSIQSVAKLIYRDRGIKGYYKGLFWRTARVTPHIAIISFVTENLTSVLMTRK